MPPVGIGWRHPHYGELLQTRPALDFIEVHSENFFGAGGAAQAVLQQARGHYPVSLHGVGLGLGSAAGIDAWHLRELAALVERVQPVRVSDHACFARAALGADGPLVHAADLLPVPFSRAALDVMCANVQRVQERLGRAILVENLSAYLVPAGGQMHEADFLAALARRSGCGLLLDLNNLYVNALNDALAAREAGLAPTEPEAACRGWLARLPAGIVGEIHLAGHCVMPDIVIDDHGSPVAAPVWRLYQHALRCLGPLPTLIEWDTDVPPLAQLLDEAAAARRHAQAAQAAQTQ